MGAFLLVSDKAGHFSKEEALKTIGEQCGTTAQKFSLPGWELFLFPKTLVKCTNFRNEDDYGVFITGTAFIPGMTYESTLDRLSADIKNGRPVADNISGLYFLLVREGDKLSFTTDTGGLYSIFHSDDNRVISSSFLSLCSGMATLSPDTKTITENLVTGSIIGSETVFREIKRFEPAYPALFEGISFMKSSSPLRNEIHFRNKSESLKGQAEILNEYFAGLKPFAEEAGIDCGITGGFDSRLLLSLACNNFSRDRLQFNSHFRHRPDSDFIIGKKLCEKLDLDFFTVSYNKFSPSMPENSEDILKRCMLFTDGQVRTHSFWHEEFNSAGNRISTLRDKKLGLNGIGGEQYRNVERLANHSWNRANWIKYNLVRRGAGRPFLSACDEKYLIDSLNEKISSRLGMGSDQRIDLYGIKRYMNEIYIPANRGLRAVNENRITWFLMPFASYEIAGAAYASVKFLGTSLSYEAELINLINHKAAAIESGYGFSFDRPEPLMKRVPNELFENILPWVIKQALYERILKGDTGAWASLIEENKTLGESISNVNDLSLPVNINALVLRKDLGPLVFAMGFLLSSFKSKIR